MTRRRRIRTPVRAAALIESAPRADRGRFESIVESLAAGEPPAAEELVQLSRVFQHRFLLVSWASEGGAGGYDVVLNLDDDTTDNVMELQRYAYQGIAGRLEGAVLDLWEDRILRKVAVKYRSGKLYGDRNAVIDEIETTRAAAAMRFADLLRPVQPD